MLLKDCPVGSVVRCVKWAGKDEIPDYIIGNFEVMKREEKYIIDNGGDSWFEGEFDNDTFEIVSMPDEETKGPKKLRFKGKSYKLTPVTQRDIIEIDGVEYYMEPA